jgi:hypothetical protein
MTMAPMGQKDQTSLLLKKKMHPKYICAPLLLNISDEHFKIVIKAAALTQNATYHRLRDTLQRNKHHQPSAYDPGKNIFGVNETNDSLMEEHKGKSFASDL